MCPIVWEKQLHLFLVHSVLIEISLIVSRGLRCINGITKNGQEPFAVYFDFIFFLHKTCQKY